MPKSFSDKVGEIEMDEAQHHNTKVRGLAESLGSRKIRLTVQEAKKAIKNMIDPKHKAPNPKNKCDMKNLIECDALLNQVIPRLKEVKECNRNPDRYKKKAN